MSSPSDTRIDGSEAEPSIAHHYVLVLVVEALVIGALGWLAATFR